MKKNTLSLVSGLSLLTLMLASCGSMKQGTAFSKAKYYNFGHHDPVVVFNETPNKYDKQVKGEASQNRPEEPKLLYVKANRQEVEVANASPVKNIERQMHSSPRIAGQPTAKNDARTGCNEKKEEEAPAYMPVYANQAAPSATTNGGGGGSVNTTVLIILAIFLSPLAVYLYDNAATGRFWLDLVLWVFGVGFLGLFLFTGLLWLVAVIYAIVIVTGH